MLNCSTRSSLCGRRFAAGRKGWIVVTLMALGACGSVDATVPTPSPSYNGGPITEAEYVSIVRGVRQCMVEKGYDAEEVAKRQDGTTYGFGFSGGGQGATNGQDDLISCEQQFGLMEAELAFQDQNALTGAAREAIFAEFSECLERAGVSGITSSHSVKEVQDKMAEFVAAGEDGAKAAACWTQYKSQLFGSAG